MQDIHVPLRHPVCSPKPGFRAFAFLGAACLAVTFPCLAQGEETTETDDPPEGHSYHGHVFNEGPRQHAVLIPGTGVVHFPVTTDSELTQRFFDQGLGQLHGYWYFEAERSFREAAAHDPDCAIAYWGMAMANVDNRDRAQAFAWQAYKRRESASTRERKFIEAYARYWAAEEEPKVKDTTRKAPSRGGRQSRPDRDGQSDLWSDLEDICSEYPEDIEAKALLVNQMYLNKRSGLPKEDKDANEGRLQDIFAATDLHPAHHYRIHLWDRNETANRSIDSAWKSGAAGPGIAHMWHMGGHTYDKLHRHGDAAWVQEASARVDHAHMMRFAVMPYEIHNYAHNNEWLCRSLRHVGRVADSVALAQNMIELPRHPFYRDRSATNGVRRLLDTLALAEQWREIVALQDSAYLDPKDTDTKSVQAFEIGRALALTGQLDEARAQLAILKEATASRGRRGGAGARRGRVSDEESGEQEGEGGEVVTEERGEGAEPGSAAGERSEGGPPSRGRRARQQTPEQLEALIEFATGDCEAAYEKLQKAGYPSEQLAVLCVEAGMPKEAAELVEDVTEAGMALPLAARAWVQWETGQRAEAMDTFGELRELSAQFDLEVPPFARLRPIAEALDLPADWRIEATTPTDIGERPDLASLGPFRWAPTPAPAWALPGADGRTCSLADYRGKPVLVVFFLGFGCVHCVEQLNAVKPVADAFEKAGISIVTIGTDPVEKVEPDHGLPFPVLGDPEGEVFKRYRCWDDFESMALHGTFLIDGKGRVRWQDISYDPFMETEFLLKESQRLLALPDTP